MPRLTGAPWAGPAPDRVAPGTQHRRPAEHQGAKSSCPATRREGPGDRGAPGWPLAENVDKALSRTHAGHSQGDPGNPGNPRLRMWGRKEVQVSTHAGGFRGASDTLGGPGRG